MKTIMKTLFVAVSSLSLMFSVNAGEMTVSGSAKATYNIVNGTQAEMGVGITNELNFTASGEMDNGYAWSYSMELDPDETDGSALNDDTQINLTLNDMGKVKVCVSECSNNKKYAWDQSAYTTLTDTGLSTGITYPSAEDSYATLQYHTPTLPFDTTASLAWGNAKSDAQSGNYDGAAASNSITAYSLVTKPVDGLTLSASYYEVNDYDDGVTTENQLEEGGAWGATYAAGNFTVGYGKSYVSPESSVTVVAAASAATVDHVINTGMSIGFAVNDQLSVSYSKEDSEANQRTSTNTTYDVGVDTIQAAYSLGGATLSVARGDYDNVSYVQDADRTETIIAMTFAF
jgi:outer membrane protein OmpU